MNPDNSEYTLIIGAGALGGMYALQIQQSDRTVAFLAEGDRANRLRDQGLSVNGIPLDMVVLSRDEITKSGRYPTQVIVALKDQHVRSALKGLSEICGTDTTCISVMNGIDSERQIAEALGESFEPIDNGRVLHCMVAGMDAVREGNSIRHTQLGRVFFGRRRNPSGSTDPRVARLQTFFDEVGIPYEIPEDMERAIWNKFMLNVGVNQWSAVLGATYSVFHTMECAKTLMRRAMQEVLAVAQGRGIALTNEDLENWFDVVDTLGPDGKTSMAQDVAAGRKTEVEMFAGRMVELGAELGIPTPVNEILLEVIHTIEGMHGVGDAQCT